MLHNQYQCDWATKRESTQYAHAQGHPRSDFNVVWWNRWFQLFLLNFLATHLCDQKWVALDYPWPGAPTTRFSGYSVLVAAERDVLTQIWCHHRGQNVKRRLRGNLRRALADKPKYPQTARQPGTLRNKIVLVEAVGTKDTLYVEIKYFFEWIPFHV